MNADLRDIRYFAAVVEQGSLTKAAQVLRVSQPTLSHAIMRLEDALGGPLWQRLPNRRAGVLPTELGRHALERGRRALAELDALAEDAALLRGLKAGELHVGSVQSLAATLIPRWVASFCEAHPGIVLDLPLVTSEAAPAMVRDGQLDAALIVGPLPNDASLKRMRAGEQELVAVVRADHALARKKHVPLIALKDESFVLIPSATFAAVVIEDICERAGFTPKVRLRLASLSGLCQLVRSGVGISILPEGCVPDGDAELVEVRFERPAPRRAVHLLYRAGAQPSPSLAAWLDTGKKLLTGGVAAG
jgi:LysR family hydrogen peroxide-inducible transcriptional activator